MRPIISPKDAIRVLNRAVEADRDAIIDLLHQRVPCNRALADDPTIQVLLEDVSKDGEGMFTLGIVGLINGLFGTQDSGTGFISSVYNVACPTHGEERPELEKTSVGDTCPIDGCDQTLVFGTFIKFAET